MDRTKTSSALDMQKIIRLVGACVLFAVALILSSKISVVAFVLLIISAGVAIYDVVLKAVDCVENKSYFATPVVLTFVAFVSFVIGFANFKIAADGTAMCIIYFAGTMIVDFAVYGTDQSANEITKYQSGKITEKLRDVMGREGVLFTKTQDVLGESSAKVLRYAMIFAALFAVVVPVVTNFMRFSEAIHRALMIVVVCTPASIVVSLNFVAKMAMNYASAQGVVFENADKMEDVSFIDTVVVDKQGIYTSGSAKLVDVCPSIIDKDTFMNFASHAAYNSEQSFAKAICSAYANDFRLDVISEFKDIPGFGVELDIAGSHVVLGTKSFIESNELTVPEADGTEKGTAAYYMVIANKYVGYVLVSQEVNSEAYSLVDGLKDNGVKRCVLLSEDSKDDSEDFAASLGYDNVYGECDMEKKQKVVAKYESVSSHGAIFLYSNSPEGHSEATVDVRVGNKARYADAIVYPEYISLLPEAMRACKRMRELSVFNAVLAFVVKAIVIFLSIIGSGSLWFAVLMDAVVSAGTILLSVRVAKESPLAAFMYKYGRDEEK